MCTARGATATAVPELWHGLRSGEQLAVLASQGEALAKDGLEFRGTKPTGRMTRTESRVNEVVGRDGKGTG